MLVRAALPSDVESLIPLVGRYWAFDGIEAFSPAAVREPLIQLLSNSHLGGGWIATEADAAVGYLLIVYVFSLEHLGLTAEIDEFYIDQAHRGARLGEALLRQAEMAAASMGCTNLSLQVSDHNQRARRFYLRAGFTARSGYELLEKEIHSDQVTRRA